MKSTKKNGYARVVVVAKVCGIVLFAATLAACNLSDVLGGLG